MQILILLQRQIGPAEDNTWEDFKVPEGGASRDNVIEYLKDTGTAGTYRVILDNPEDPLPAEVWRFEIRRKDTYELVDLPIDPSPVDPSTSGSPVLEGRHRMQHPASIPPPRRGGNV